MKDIVTKLNALAWEHITSEMHLRGFALISKLLTEEQCETLRKSYHNPHLYRKTVVMERHRFGLGEYKYFQYPLPELIQIIRELVYAQLAPIANAWMKALHIKQEYPGTLPEMLKLCYQQNQEKPTVLILKYGPGGFNTLHQDLYGAIYFPIQVVLFLNKPGQDYTGGEFVLTEQVPRAQSNAQVLTPGMGDMLIFTTNFRPVKGTKRYYRTNMKHGVSEVRSGERHTLGIIFHDALN